MCLRSFSKDENAAFRCILLGHPFPLMGKGQDRGARKPIEPITPTFVPSAGLRTTGTSWLADRLNAQSLANEILADLQHNFLPLPRL